jgi:magnesium chelatase family protein
MTRILRETALKRAQPLEELRLKTSGTLRVGRGRSRNSRFPFGLLDKPILVACKSAHPAGNRRFVGFDWDRIQHVVDFAGNGIFRKRLVGACDYCEFVPVGAAVWTVIRFILHLRRHVDHLKNKYFLFISFLLVGHAGILHLTQNEYKRRNKRKHLFPVMTTLRQLETAQSEQIGIEVLFGMYGKVMGACLQGIEGNLIEVEVNLTSGLPQMNIVGLPDSAVRESVERVRAALKNCEFRFPMERITVNLAPADVRKEGASFDLAIAIGLITTSGQHVINGLEKCLIAGELALDGSLRPIPGVLSMVDAAKKRGLTHAILPLFNAPEARLIDGIEVIGLSHLNEVRAAADTDSFNDINHSKMDRSDDMEHNAGLDSSLPLSAFAGLDDYADVCGQQHAKRALLIAASGMHNIMLVGPPGSGKTMLIRRLSSILPPLTDQEALEVTKVYSAAGAIADRSRFIRIRPFRSPHHTISSGGLIGAGSIPKPGEISLAHKGVLFLDEMPEFPRYVLEALRQPLEDRRVTISRAKAVYTFPAHFILAASMNPCPCS